MEKLIRDYDTSVDDFRFQISSILTLSTSILVSPFVVYYFIIGNFKLALILAANISFFIYKYFRAQQKQLDPNSTFIFLFILFAIPFYLTATQYGVIGFFWVYPILFIYYFLLPEKYAWVANAIFLALVFFVAYKVLSPYIYIRIFVTCILASISLIIFIRIISNQHEDLKNLAIIDPLTNVYNRTLLETELNKAIAQHSRNQVPVSIAIIDIDHFKSINDTYGHDEGDKALQQVAQVLTGRLRRNDMVFRIGGEEFLILFNGNALDQTKKTAEFLCNKVSSAIKHIESKLTVSIGLAEYKESEDIESWMSRADKNLYYAKNNGRNQVSANIDV